MTQPDVSPRARDHHGSLIDRLRAVEPRLFQPIDVAGLAVFRMLFGAIVVWEVWRYFDMERIRRYYVQPDFHFKYYGFGWVEAWPGDGMYWHFIAMGVLGVCITVGFLYRASAILFFLAFTYMFLIDQSRYLNHFYLLSLLSFIMIFVPAHRQRSVDAVLWPARASRWVPAWPLWLLRAQLGVVYVYAAVAKMNHDWLRGQPLVEWIADRADDPILGPLLGHDWSGYLFSYGGLLLDLFIVPLLLWPRTRVYAFIAALCFHLLNARLFSIGIFPWMMIAATTLFLPPDWPRRLMPTPKESPPRGALSEPTLRRRRVVISLLGVWFAIQVLVPLRHWLYPGIVHWTEEGHRFAWHMKLRDKEGRTHFFVRDPAAGTSWRVEQDNYLTRKQQDEMAGRPDMLLQFAHHVGASLREQGSPPIEIRVDSRISLNGRAPQLLIDPEVDLLRQRRTLGHAAWILPLETPLP